MQAFIRKISSVCFYVDEIWTSMKKFDRTKWVCAKWSQQGETEQGLFVQIPLCPCVFREKMFLSSDLKGGQPLARDMRVSWPASGEGQEVLPSPVLSQIISE